MSDNDTRLTMPVLEAGRRFFGLGRNASYEAARSGDLPTVKINGRRYASIPAIKLMLRNAGKARTASEGT